MKKTSVRRVQWDWLPVDSRLIPPIFAFSHIKGLARLFLVVEMTLTTLVVIGTFILVLRKAFGW